MKKTVEKKANLHATTLRAKAARQKQKDTSGSQKKIEETPKVVPYEPSLNLTVAGHWPKANLIALVNGSPSMTAVSVHNLILYKSGILEYQLPVRNSADMTVLFTDLRCWLVQPSK